MGNAIIKPTIIYGLLMGILVSGYFAISSSSGLEKEVSPKVMATIAGMLDEAIHLKSDSEVTTVTVWIDPQCPSCRQFLKLRSEYLDSGISINILPYPVKTGSMEFVQKVWCSPKKLDTLLELEEFLDNDDNGEFRSATIVNTECAARVASLKETAASIGVIGTPMFLLINEKLVLGFPSPKYVIEQLSFNP